MKHRAHVAGAALLCASLFSIARVADGQGAPSSTGTVPAHKPIIGFEVLEHWVRLEGDPKLSNDGRYVAYGAAIGTPDSNAGYDDHNSKLILAANDGSWRKELPGKVDGFFSGNNRDFVYHENGTLFFVQLGTDRVQSILNVAGLKHVVEGVSHEWLAWTTTDDLKKLMLRDLMTGQQRSFPSVIDYELSHLGNSLLIKTENTGGEAAATSSTSLTLTSLPVGDPVVLWRSHPDEKLMSYTFDPSGTRVALSSTRQDHGEMHHSLAVYTPGKSAAEEIVNERSPGIDANLTLGDDIRFSETGKRVYFNLKEPESPRPPKEAISVDVWSYNDAVQQAQQLRELAPRQFLATVDLDGERIVRIEDALTKLTGSFHVGESDHYGVVRHDETGERFWMKGLSTTFLIDLRDGSRREFKCDCGFNALSPGERYVVYFRESNVYAMDTSTGVERNLSASIPAGWLTAESQQLFSSSKGWSKVGHAIVGWLSGDRGVLINDDYDIWQVDLSGSRKPINITRGYGRRNGIKLRLEEDGPIPILADGTALRLLAFNTATKESGFYQMRLGKSRDPERLIMGPWVIDRDAQNFFVAGEYSLGMAPVKARDANIWIVKRASPTEAPNYFLTQNFKTFRALTDLQPQRSYNWYTKELVTYPQLDGTMIQGLLYKPEDFDSAKHYPVILQYYLQFSNGLYDYDEPDYSESRINVPWYVSHGYLVFVPDIHYPSQPFGPHVVNAVDGAGKFLASLPYVDAQHLGIIGHSWGGTETNYLITHTHRFAAAVSVSEGHAAVDWISSSLQVGSKGQFVGESQLNLEHDDAGDVSIWENPQFYLENSPVFKADQITTPFLLKKDNEDQNAREATEMFMALWRLGKKAWRLQYDNGGHTLAYPESMDFTIRVQQFFDHYLKGAPPPKWMTQGIPARMKGIDSGLELDTSGREP